MAWWPVVRLVRDRIGDEDCIYLAALHRAETQLAVLDKSRTRTRRGYLWVYVGDYDNVVFEYTPTRSCDGPLAFLGDYAGYVQADAYSGYDEYFRTSGATEVGCWAHTRRKFVDAKQTDGRAQLVLALIGRLYAIESQARDRGLDAAALCRVRQERSKPILDQIERLIHQWSSEVLPKSPLGQAVGYARRQWAALTRYLSDGELDIDNNAAERAPGLRHGSMARTI